MKTHEILTRAKTHEKRGGGKARGSHWPGSRRHRHLMKRMAKRPRRSPDVFGVCARCTCKFIPAWCDTLGVFNRCCEPCRLRNLFDALDFPEGYEKAGLPVDKFSLPKARAIAATKEEV